MTIRRANSADRGSLQRLYESLCPGEPIDVRSDRIEEIARDPNSHLVVAEEAGVVAATAFLTICLDPMFGLQPYGVVENVVVDEIARGHGVGTRLLEHVEQLCRSAHCSKIMLLSSAQRVRAHRFFARLGYSDTISRGFKKYLGGPRRPADASPQRP